MPTFEIEQYELWTSKFQVEAADAAEAIMKLRAGDGVSVDNSSELIQPAEQWGLPIGDNQELYETLSQRGVMMNGMVIPSIRAIEEV